MRRFLKALSLTICVAAVVATSRAATRRSESIQIPFDFKLLNKQFPAGTYYLEPHGDFVTLVNVQTGDRRMMLRPSGAGADGKTAFVFENAGDGYVLKKLR